MRRGLARLWRAPLGPGGLAALALALELALLWLAWRSAFAGERGLVPERADLPLAHGILWLLGGGAGGLALAQTHRALREFGMLAALSTALAMVPLLVGGLGSPYASLILAGIL